MNQVLRCFVLKYLFQKLILQFLSPNIQFKGEEEEEEEEEDDGDYRRGT